MKIINKIIIILATLLLLTSCTANNDIEINEFQEKYNVETNLVKKMSYEDFLTFTESKTGVVFIGDDAQNTKELAKVFCDTLCECDINKVTM